MTNVIFESHLHNIHLKLNPIFRPVLVEYVLYVRVCTAGSSTALIQQNNIVRRFSKLY